MATACPVKVLASSRRFSKYSGVMAEGALAVVEGEGDGVAVQVCGGRR
ncbi:MAG: hypothetical protein R3B46_09895 [Phycisphaerales bacterium]